MADEGCLGTQRGIGRVCHCPSCDPIAQPATEHHVGTLDLSGEGNRAEVASPISDEAIALAAQAFYGGAYLVPDSEMNDLLKQGARAALEAAYPAIREQVAEEIAVAIADAEGFNGTCDCQDCVSTGRLVDMAREIGGRGGDATAPGSVGGASGRTGLSASPSDPQAGKARRSESGGSE